MVHRPDNFRLFRPFILCLPLFVAACISPVDYGKIPHTSYVANARCNPVVGDDGEYADKPHFVVTSRLPDCRVNNVKLLNHRSDRVRFGRFDGPQDFINAKGKTKTRIPFSLTNEKQWWDDLSKQMGPKQIGGGEGRVLLYVHGFRETFFISSKDTAQMARLSNFNGPVIQYSWPSQGQLLKYVTDETNMAWAERDFRKFLLKLAQQKWTMACVLFCLRLHMSIDTPPTPIPAIFPISSSPPLILTPRILNISLPREYYRRGE